MLAPVSKTSHSPTPDVAHSPARRAVAPEDSTLAQLQKLANQSAATTRLQRLSDSANQTHPAPTQQRSKGTAQLVGSTSLQRGPAPSGQYQAPGLIGATNTPVSAPVLDEMGMTATTLSDADYANWKGTAQAKLNPHGMHSHGGITTVTQFKSNQWPLQLLSLGPRAKKWLIVGEALLSIVAGSVALGLAIASGLVPAMIAGIMSIGVGLLKLARAYQMNKKENATSDEDKAKADKWINWIRGIEAVLAAIGAAMVLTDPKALASGVALGVFALAKLIRSIATAIAGDKKTSTAAKVASVAHVVEVAALGFAGGFTLGVGAVAEAGEALAGAPKIGAGAAMIVVGASKAVRGGDQLGEAFPKSPTNAGQQNNAGGANGVGEIGAGQNDGGMQDAEDVQHEPPAVLEDDLVNDNEAALEQEQAAKIEL